MVALCKDEEIINHINQERLPLYVKT